MVGGKEGRKEERRGMKDMNLPLFNSGFTVGSIAERGEGQLAALDHRDELR